MPLSLSQEQSIQRLYLAYFNRPADVAGIKAWTEALNNGATEAQIAEGFANSPEFKATYKDQSTINYVNALYNNLLGRNSDAEGLVFWVNMVDSGRISKAQLPLQLTEYTGFTDSKIILNKLHAATAFTTALKTAADPAALALAYQPSNAVAMATAHAYLSAIDYMPASLEQALASLPNLIKQFDNSGNQTTQNIVEIIDKNANTISGSGITNARTTGAGNDLIKIKDLYLSNTAVIDGGSGNDTLELTGYTAINKARISSIEMLKINASNDGIYVSSNTNMTLDQYLSFSGSIYASGSNDTISFVRGENELATAKSKGGSFTALDDIESYNCNLDADYTVIGSSKGNRFYFDTELTSSDIVKGGSSANDQVIVKDKSNAISDFDNITAVESITIWGLQSNSRFNYKPAGAFAADATPVKFYVNIDGDNCQLNLDLSNISNRALIIDFGHNNVSSQTTIAVNTTIANSAKCHIVRNLGANDKIDMPGHAERIYQIELYGFEWANLAKDVNAKLAKLPAYTPAVNDLILVKYLGGSDANYFAIADLNGDGISSTDTLIHIIGTEKPLDSSVFI